MLSEWQQHLPEAAEQLLTQLLDQLLCPQRQLQLVDAVQQICRHGTIKHANAESMPYAAVYPG